MPYRVLGGTDFLPCLQVCIFDADQLANSDFYNKTVPLFDRGDDVGMVLSPQAFHNLNVHADIFNHSNIHFWEYSQPGYDALGFISCTGIQRRSSVSDMRQGLRPSLSLGMSLPNPDSIGSHLIAACPCCHTFRSLEVRAK